MKKWVSFCLLGLAIGARVFADTRENDLNAVYTQIGQPLAGAETLPIAHFLERVLGDLTATQGSTTHRGLLLVNHLHIIESPDFNSFVLTRREPGQDAQENHVFITTGIIKAILDEPAGLAGAELAAHRADRLEALVGVLAHELGHPVDGAKKFSLELLYGSRRADQAMELRADLDGSALLRRSGYPEDAIYQAKQIIIAIEKKKNDGKETGVSDLWGAYRSDHPDLVANQTMNRLLLTHSRLDRGQGGTAHFQAALASFSPQDYHSVAVLPSQRRDGFVPPVDLAQAIERLRTFLDEKELTHGINKKVDDLIRNQLNRHLLALEDKLLERSHGGPLSPQEEEDLLLVFHKLIEAEGAHFDHSAYLGDLIFSAEEIQEHLAPPGSLSYFSGHEPHESLMEKIPFFHSPKYLAMVREMGGRNGGLYTRHREYLVSRFMRAEDYFPFLSDNMFALQMKREQARRIHEHPEYYPGKLPNELDEFRDFETLFTDLSGGSVGFRTELGGFLLREAFLDQSESNRFKLFREIFFHGGTNAENYLPALMLVNGLSPEERDQVRRQVLDYLEAHPDLKETYRQAAQFFWDHRGEFSILELSRIGTIDWKLAASLVGQSPEHAPEEAAQAALDFVAHSPEFPSFAAWGATLKPELDRALSPAQQNLLQHLQGTPLETFARPLIAIHDLDELHSAEALRNWYRDGLRAQLPRQAGRPSVEALEAIHSGALRTISSDVDGLRRQFRDLRLGDVLAEEIDHSALPEAEKQEWLKAAFLDFHPELHRHGGLNFTPVTWVADPAGAPPGAAARVLAVLQRHGLISSASAELEAIRRLRAEGLWRRMKDFAQTHHHGYYFDMIDQSFQAAYSEALDALADPLATEIAQVGRGPETDAEKIARITELAALLAPPVQEGADAARFRAQRLSGLQETIVRAAAPLQVTLQARKALFDRLAAAGPTLETDAYFRAQILPFLGNEKAVTLRDALSSHRFFSRGLQVEVAREVLEPEVHALEGRQVPSASLQALVEHLERLVPDQTEARDTLLEDYSWRLGLSRPGELNFIESHKSTNLRRLSPQLARWASLASESLSVMDAAGRHRLMSYLVDPHHRPFTREMEDDVRKALRKVIENEQKNRGLDDGRLMTGVEEMVERRLADFKQSLVQFAQDSTPLERIPIFDLLLNLDGLANGVGRSATARESIARELLGVQPGSDYEKSLLTYLDLVPEHERSVTLAYLLAHAQEGQRSVADFFLAFGAPGIRAGQQSVLWGLLPNHGSPELDDLFDRARPQSRAEIIRFLRRRFPNRNFKVKRRLGSATSLTAVEVEWKEPDGHGGRQTRTAAVLIRRPHVLAQLRSQVAMGKEYLKRLRAQGLESQARFLEPLLTAQEAQLKDELDFRKVGSNLDRLRATVEGRHGLGTRISATSPGVRFRVPHVYHELGDEPDVLFMEVAGGKTFLRASGAEQARVGEPLVRLLTESLLNGAYQANPSGGNFLVQPDGPTTTVWLIDGGQIGELGSQGLLSTEGSRFAAFLRALDGRDPRAIVGAVRDLGVAFPPGVSRQGLERELRASLEHSPRFEGAAHAILDVLATHQMALDPRYTFTGGLKTILELVNSGILPRPRIERILADAVRRKLTRNPLGGLCEALFAGFVR